MRGGHKLRVEPALPLTPTLSPHSGEREKRRNPCRSSFPPSAWSPCRDGAAPRSSSRARSSGAASPAIYAPSVFANMSLCEALCHVTERIAFATSIAPIYARTVGDFAQSAAFMHEVSGGRFRLGIGVSHAPAHVRMGVTPGKPLGDIRAFVEKLRAHDGIGALPPIMLATLRKQHDRARRRDRRRHGVRQRRALAHGRLAGGAAGGQARRPGFFIGNMIPTCISDDIEAAKAVNRKTLTHYALLPNYRNYWKEAGYVEEMEAIEKAIAEKRMDDVPNT